MTAAEIGSVVGAALVGGGAVVGIVAKIASGNGKAKSVEQELLREALRDQMTVLQQIRDGIMAIKFELSAQRDKQVAIADTLAAMHQRLDGVAGKRKL